MSLPDLNVSRRSLIASAALLGGCAATGMTDLAPAAISPGFVTRDGMRFLLDGKPYRFVGANVWYGAYLGADAAFGDRDRLRRELDMLKAIGVTNLRVLASSEDGPLKYSIHPSFRDRTDAYNPVLLGGLDYLLAEMAKREMKAVLYLTNFWDWSGGMMTYLHYFNGGKYIDMNDPAHPWPEFPDFNAAFYATPPAVRLYHDYVRAVVTRTNSITGKRYADDPAIMSWQLANEPRPGGTEALTVPKLPAFYAWIEGTAKLIKSLDPNHLVSTGGEGLKGAIEREDVVIAAHRPAEIDYLTIHIWPQNWSWIDGKNIAGTYAKAEPLIADYIAQHDAMARKLGKPMVIEEFGYPRDGGGYDAGGTTLYRDRFYRMIFDAALNSMKVGGPIAGTNFWAWGGEGRAMYPDRVFRDGDVSYMGDPPSEPQGWYSVLASDAATKALIADHARAVTATIRASIDAA